MSDLAREMKEHADATRAARETLSLTLEDVEASCESIDAACRALVSDVMDSIETTPAAEEDGNAADFLRHIAEIWSQAHTIRRTVERDDEDEAENVVSDDAQGKTAAESAVSS